MLCYSYCRVLRLPSLHRCRHRASESGMAGSDSGAWKILMPRGIVIPHLLASPKWHRLDDSGPAGVRIAPSHSRNQSKDASYLVPVQEAISKGELADPTDLEGILYDVHNRLIGLRRYDLLRALAKPYYLKGIGTYLSRDPCNPTQLHTSLLALRNGGKTMRHG
jgi:hypothetical protein